MYEETKAIYATVLINTVLLSHDSAEEFRSILSGQ